MRDRELASQFPSRNRWIGSRRRRSRTLGAERFAYRPGTAVGLVERLEERRLLSSDLTADITGLINGGKLNGTYTYSDVSLGSFLTIPSVDVTLVLSQNDSSHWTGTVSLDAASASLAFDSAVTGSISSNNASAGLIGSYSLTDAAAGSGGYKLTAQDLKLAVGSAFTAEATGVRLSYAPNGAANQPLATISSATATFQPLNNATATIKNLTVSENGFSLGDGSATADSLDLGGILSASSPSVTFTNVSDSNGTLSGTIGVSAGSVAVLAGESGLSKGGNGLTLTGFTGSYTLPADNLSIGATGASLSLGQLIQAKASGVTLDYNPAAPSPVVVDVASLTAVSPLLSPDITGTVTNLQASSAGLSFDSASLSDAGTITLGGVLEVQNPSITVNSFDYTTAGGVAPTATATLTTAGASLFPGQSAFTATVTGVSGTYAFGSGQLSLTANKIDLGFGKILSADATEVAIGWDGTNLSVNLDSATLSSPDFPTVTGTLTDVSAGNAGLSIGSAKLEDTGKTSLGNVFSVTDLTLGVSQLTYSAASQSITSGTVTVGAGAVELFPNRSDFTTVVTGFQGTYNLTDGSSSLSAGQITLSFGQVLEIDATDVAINWDGSSASFSLGGATLSSPEFPNFSGSLSTVTVDANGFSIDLASFTDASNIPIGSVLTIDGPTTITATNLVYTNSTSTSASSLAGTIGLSFGGLEILPGSSAFSTSVTGFEGSYDLTSQKTTLSVDSIVITVGGGSNGSSTSNPILTVTASNVGIALSPGGNGQPETVAINVGSATAALNEFDGLNGNVTNLSISNDGFSIGSATLDVNGTTPGSSGQGTISAFGGRFQVVNPSVTLKDFGYSISSGAFPPDGMSLSADRINLNQGGADVVATALTTTISFSAGDVGHTTIMAGTLTVNLGSYVTLTGSDIKIDTAAADGYYVQLGSLSATLTVGSLGLTGTATDFAIDANGKLVTLPGFGVTFSTDSSTSGKLQWPSWMPITISTLGVSWPRGFTTDQSDVQLTLSAQASAGFSGGAFNISGSVTNAVIDLGLLDSGKFPLVSIDRGSLTVGGKMGGAAISGTAFVGITDGIFYGGIEGSLQLGKSGVSIWVGLSQQGPLDLFVDSEIPILLDPESGLAIQSIRGGVEFGTSLAAPKSPQDLVTSSSYTMPASQTTAEWEQSLTTAVANQVSSGTSGFAALGNTFVITAGVTLYDEYATANAFTLSGDIEIDTTGKLLAAGNLTFGGSQSPVQLQAGAFLDLSQVASGHATLDWYMLAPASAPILSIYGAMVITVTDPNTSDATIDINISGNADMSVPDIKGGLNLQGSADFLITPSARSLDLTVSGTASLDPLGTFGEMSGQVFLFFDGSTPELDGVFQVSVNTSNISSLSSLGLGVNATGFVEFNTTSSVQSVSITPPGSTQATTYQIQPTSAVLDVPNAVLTYTPPGTSTSVLEVDASLFASFVLATTPSGGVDPELDIAFSGSASIGPAPDSVSVSASGILIINSSGLAASFTVSAGTGDAIPGVAINAALALTINTTGQTQSFTVPNIADPNKPGSYLAGSGQTYAIPGTYTINGTTTSGFYIALTGSGEVSIENAFSLDGNFDILVSASLFRLDLNQMSLNVPSLGDLGLSAQGGLLIDSGGIAGAVSVTAGAGMSGPGGAYLLDGTFTLAVNTTSQDQTIGGISVLHESALVSVAGNLDIADAVLDLAGTFTLSVWSSGLTIGGSFTATILGATVGSGTFDASIYEDSGGIPALALYAGLSVNGNFGSGFVDFSANPTLEINTGQVDQTFADGNVAPAETAQVALNNASISVLGFHASGSLIATISNSGLDIVIPQSDPISLGFLSLGTMQVYGFIDAQNGGLSFSLTGSISYDVTSGPFELYGGIGATIASTGFAGWFYGGANLNCGDLGTVNLASISASITVMTTEIDISASADVLGLSFSFNESLGGYSPPSHSPGLFSYSVPTSAVAGSVPTLSAVAYDPSNNQIPADNYTLEWDVNGPPDVLHGDQPYYQTSTDPTFTPTLGGAGTYNVSLYQVAPDGTRQLLKQSTINVIIVAPTIHSLNMETAYLTSDSTNGSGSQPGSSTTISLSPLIVTTNESLLEPAGYDPNSPSPPPQSAPPTSGSYWEVSLNGVATYYPGLYPKNVTLAPVDPLAISPPDYTATLFVRDPYNGDVQQTGTFHLLDVYNLTVNDAGDGTVTGVSQNGSMDLTPVNGDLTLRRALDIIYDNAQYSSGRVATIRFAPSLAGQTIYLNQDEYFGYGPVASNSLIGATDLGVGYPTIIDGSGAPGLTIANAPGSNRRLFFVGRYGNEPTNVSLTLEDLTLEGGSATGTGDAAYGGAIYITDGSMVTADHVGFLNNQANAQVSPQFTTQNAMGGAVYMDIGTSFTAIDSTFSGNAAVGSPVAEYNNVVYAQAGSGLGGAIYDNLGELKIISSTIAQNSVAGNGSDAGSGVDLFYGSVTTIDNTIIADNTGAADLTLDAGSSTRPTGTNNLIQSSQGGTPTSVLGITGKDPMLGSLAQRGSGDLWTYSLLPGSPALGAGSTSYLGGATTDGRGLARTVGGQVDIGAFERQSYIVDSTQGSGPGSLAQAVATDDDGSAIVFAPGFSSITAVPMVIAYNIAIEGPGANVLTLNGAHLSQLFKVEPGITATIAGLTLAGGLAANTGGAVDNLGILTLLNDVLTGNTAVGAGSAGGEGGAVYNGPAATLVLYGDTFSNNTAVGGTSPASVGAGGAIYSAPGSALLGNDDTFAGNTAQGGAGGTFYAQGYGGALVSDGRSQLVNVTMAGNSALSGASSTAIVQVRNSLPPSDGADIWVDGGVLTLVNSIAADPVAGVDIVVHSGQINGSNNLVMASVGVPAGLVVATADPQLRPLGNYGGPTPTLELIDGSPAIGTALASALPPTDQRGLPTQGDLGAFQLRHGFVVTNTNDSGPGSLRQVLIDDIDQTPITFASSLAGQTITLFSTILLSNDIQIDGSGAPGLTITGSGTRIFVIGSGVNVTIDDLTLANGLANLGGAIDNNGNLNLLNDTFSNNIAQGDISAGILGVGAGGAIYNASGSTLTVTGSTFINNRAVGAPGQATPTPYQKLGGGQGQGGAIDNEANARVILINDTFTGNQADGGSAYLSADGEYSGGGGSALGGGLMNDGTAELTNDTFSANSASAGSGKPMGSSLGSELYNSASLILNNTILANGNGGEDFYWTSESSVKGANNLVTSTNKTPPRVISSTSNPDLGALGNNGGLTETFALQPNSPALGAGGTVGVPATDQRGDPRMVTGKVDIGSYETQIVHPIPSAGGPYVGYAGQSVTLDASGTSNPSNLRLTYHWTLTGNGVSLASSGVTWSLSLASLPVGNFTVTLTVSDNYFANQTESAKTTLSVLAGLTTTAILPANRAPAVNAVFDTATISFAYPVNLATLNAGSLSLTLDGGPNLLPANVQVTRLIQGSDYQISGLAQLMTRYGQGQYTLSVDASKVQGAAPDVGFGSGTLSASWIYDTVAPTSRVTALPAVSQGASFYVSVTGNDPSAAGVVASGVAYYAIDVSVDGGPLTAWTNVPATAPSALYTGTAGHSYAFQSIAHDLANNVESKPQAIEASSYVRVTQPPAVVISAVDSSSQQFAITLAGSSAPGTVLDHIDVFVSVDGEPFRPIAKVAGVNVPVTFEAIADGSVHNYAFYAVGTDTVGNVQAPPVGPGYDTWVAAGFATPAANAPIALSVDHGASGRSFIGSVDLVFDNSNGLASLVADGNVHLIRHSLSGTGATPVSLTGMLGVVDNAIEINFGSLGLGGSPDSSAGDGYYEIDIDGLARSFFFDRVFGDVNGDGIVNTADASLTTGALGQQIPGALINLDGTGTVTPLARLAALRARGHGLTPGLRLDA